MSRFFKSAAFPILIVVVLAFFAVKAGQPAARATAPPHNYQTLVAEELPEPAKSSRSSSRTRATSLDVTLKNKEEVRGRLRRPGRAAN